MPTLEILYAAAEEAEAAVDWYEQEQPGLGRRVRDPLNAGLDLLEGGLVTGSLFPGNGHRTGRLQTYRHSARG